MYSHVDQRTRRMWRALVKVGFALALAGMLLAGCTETQVPTATPPPADAAKVARVVCEKDGSTSIATPDVLAQRDGVHVRVVSHLDESASMLGLGFDVDLGSSDWVSAYRRERSTSRVGPSASIPREVSSREEVPHDPDPDSSFVEWELQCIEDDDGTALDIRLLVHLAGRRT